MATKSSTRLVRVQAYFRDVYEGICLVKEADKGTKFLDPNHLWHGRLSTFASRTKPAMISLHGGILVARVDWYALSSSLSPNPCFSDDVDGFSTLTDDNLNSAVHQSWWYQFSEQLAPPDALEWLLRSHHDFKTRFLGLSKSFRQDFCSNPLILILSIWRL